MAGRNINMLQSNADFTILTDEIWARNEITSSIISIPFKIEFTGTPGYKGMLKADVLFFKAEMRTRDTNIFCGQSIIFSNAELSSQRRTLRAQFDFRIAYEAINKIEKERKGDLTFSIAVTAQSAEHKEVILADNKTHSFVTGFDQASGHIDFQIAQSYWINKLLPATGHQSFRLIELPTASQIIPAEYEAALNELEEAKKFYMLGHYDKVASHCRVALEPFKKQMPELKKLITSESTVDWIKALGEGTFEWLDKIVKTTYAVTSKAHHPPSFGHFTKTDAEIIMMVTTATIAFIGKVGK